MTAENRAPRPPRNRPVAVPRRRSPLRAALFAVAVVIFAVVLWANVWTEVTWYDQVGYSDVWWTQVRTQALLWLAFGLVAAAAAWSALMIARRARPRLTEVPTRMSVREQYGEQIEVIERIALWAVPAVVGLFAGYAASSQWETILAWWYRVPFGIVDPQYGMDISFFVFTLPALHMFVSYALGLTVVCAILAVFVHLLYGSITGSGREFVATPRARLQLALLGAAIMLLIAVKLWVDRFDLVASQGELYNGAGYTAVNAILPSRVILVGIAVMVALMFLAVIARPDWRIPTMGVALMILAAIVVGGIYPAVVERFQVEPNQQVFEEPFIQRDIDATLAAFGMDDIDVIPYSEQTGTSDADLRLAAQTTASIRLLDPNIVAPAFQQLQQNKQYYAFSDGLSVDRYRINGEIRDTVLAVRELNLDGLSEENRSWVNVTTVFTHGFGVVAAFGNATNDDGEPTFYEGGIPSTGDLPAYEPRIYFGQGSPPYSIVGAPEGTTPWELDYPDDVGANGQVNTTYSGDGGPAIGTTLQKLAFAIKFGEEQILFSDRVTAASQVLYYRDPIERVARVAPYLELDANAYPAVVDGRVVWVVDGYTTTSQYPYAQGLDAAGVFADLTPGSTLNDSIDLNYVRNSVKAIVDAYDGSVTLYAWDPEDPILATWARVYPTSLKSIDEISGDLMSHLRYPEGLFKIQRYLLASYHVTDAASYYSASDFWRNPADPTQGETTLQPPYYLSLQMPGQTEPTFSLTSSFIPGGNSDRNILTGFLAVNSETGNTPGVPDADYGKLRLLELPRESAVPGPGQVQNTFSADPEAQNVLNLLRQGATDVLNGNLLTLPIGDGLLYVQPVYVQSSTGTKFPLLQKVFVAFGDEVGFADTLDEALDQIFGSLADPVDPDPEVTDPEVTDPEVTDPEVTDPEVTDPVAVSAARLALQNALNDARDALVAGESALAVGDFAAYGEAQDALSAAISAAIAAETALDALDA